MSMPFARSVRSLQADGFRLSMVAVLVITALFGLWLTWFFLARLSLVEVSRAAILESPQTVLAEFPATTYGRLQPGQPAVLRLDAFPWTQYGLVSATVTDVRRIPDEDSVQVWLAIASANPAIPLQPGLTATAEVQVGRASPAALILRAAGGR